jgi:ubiquinone/menaquinone biosynthesis C-methylase UbiE
MNEPQAEHFFNRFDRFESTKNAIRLRHRYEAIVSRNRELFHNARVLNLHSGDGCWCMAALDARAEHVVGVDPSHEAIEAARTTFIEYGIASESYQFINSDISPALKTMNPGAFDLVVCHGSFEESDPHQFFWHLYRLEPKHVILDTDVSRGEGPIIRFKLRHAFALKGARRQRTIVATPNHELIAFLCEYFGFEWRLIAWQTIGIIDWSSISDYGRGRRRTYVLNRL